MPRRNYRRHDAHRLQDEMGWLFDGAERIDTPREHPEPVVSLVPRDLYEVVARFASDPSTRIGRCLIVNTHRCKAVIRKYGKGCSTCADSVEWASSSIQDADPFDDSVPFAVMLRRAATLDDPDLPGRPMMPGDHGFPAVEAMYVQFTMLCIQASRLPSDVAYIAWSASTYWCERRVWSDARYRAIVRLQACLRGHLFRKHVLWSPHTDIGGRFLRARFAKELGSET